MRLRWLVPLLGSLLAVSILFLAVFPTRTYLSQREAIRVAHERLAVLTEQSEALEERARLLQTDEEIERIAREQYNLVMPGEEAYALLPAPAPLPPVAPVTDSGAEDPDDRPGGLVERVWAFVTGG